MNTSHITVDCLMCHRTASMRWQYLAYHKCNGIIINLQSSSAGACIFIHHSLPLFLTNTAGSDQKHID
jgi:hypothetical protein